MPKGMLKRSYENPIAAKIRSALGVGPTAPVEAMTPQFTREPGYPEPAAPPADSNAFLALRSMDAKALRELGLRPWGEPEDDEERARVGDGSLWLFPGEWYAHIPNGLPIVDIFFHRETFLRGTTDNDIRFGCLSFGMMGPRLAGQAPTDGDEARR